jgi:CRP/FNR family transcriptional regulator, cyclic AMP receptor protein
MIERFEGESGRRLRIDALTAQKMVCGHRALADELADRVRLRALKAGEALIEQGADDNEVYFVLAGTCDVVVNGRKVGKRGPGDHLGEMAAIQPAQKRSASVLAAVASTGAIGVHLNDLAYLVYNEPLGGLKKASMSM